MLTLEKYLSNIPKPINKACWNNYHNIRVSSREHSTCLARPPHKVGYWVSERPPVRSVRRSVSPCDKDRNTNINLHVATHPWTAGSQRERQPTLAIELCDVAPVWPSHPWNVVFFLLTQRLTDCRAAGGSWEVELIIVALRLSFKDKIFQQLWHC